MPKKQNVNTFNSENLRFFPKKIKIQTSRRILSCCVNCYKFLSVASQNGNRDADNARKHIFINDHTTITSGFASPKQFEAGKVPQDKYYRYNEFSTLQSFGRTLNKAVLSMALLLPITVFNNYCSFRQ